MSNFYSNLFAKETSAVAQDARENKSEKCYLVTCRDSDGAFLRLMNAIKKSANGGHSFDVVVDPDTKDKTTVFIDGDGSDHISSIVSFPENTDLVGILLSNFNTIRWICKGAIPDDPTLKTADPIDALKTIHTSCDALLDGANYDFGKSTKELLKLILTQLNDNTKTAEQRVEHLKWVCEHELERKESAMKPEPSK